MFAIEEKEVENGAAALIIKEEQEDNFAEMLEAYVPKPLSQGQIITGEILKIGENTIWADVDAKRTAVVPREDIDLVADKYLEQLSVGDEIVLYVLRTPQGDEDLLVSLNLGLQQKDWTEAKEYLDNEEVVELKVIGHNKGGLLVAFGQIQGFVPSSHVPQLQNIHNQQTLTTLKNQAIGKELTLKVIEVDRERRRLVLSAKKAQKEVRQQRLEELKAMELETITGTVSSLAKFGAFVHLDGIEGLIHISEISWQKIDKPSQVLSVGEEVEVLIQSVDIERERISLSYKALQPSPWETFAEAHSEGDLIEGVVINVTDFGVFVETKEGLTGLVHISEIVSFENSPPHFPGDRILVRIVNIDPENGRLGLSCKRVSTQEEVDWLWQNNMVPALYNEEEE